MEGTISETEALEAYARMINLQDFSQLESLLPDDFCYASQMVFEEITSKQQFADYIIPKLITMSQSQSSRPYAEMGSVVAFRQEQEPCVILSQGSKGNKVGTCLATVKAGKLQRLDMCIIPTPESCIGTGNYPGLK